MPAVTVVVTQSSTVWVKPTPVVKVASAAAAAAGLQSSQTQQSVASPLVKIVQASAELPVASTSRAVVADVTTVQATVMLGGAASTTTAVESLRPIVIVTRASDGTTSTITAAAVVPSASSAAAAATPSALDSGTAPFNLSSVLKLAPTTVDLGANTRSTSTPTASSSSASPSDSAEASNNSNFFASLGHSPISITLTVLVCVGISAILIALAAFFLRRHCRRARKARSRQLEAGLGEADAKPFDNEKSQPWLQLDGESDGEATPTPDGPRSESAHSAQSASTYPFVYRPPTAVNSPLPATWIPFTPSQRPDNFTAMPPPAARRVSQLTEALGHGAMNQSRFSSFSTVPENLATPMMVDDHRQWVAQHSVHPALLGVPSVMRRPLPRPSFLQRNETYRTDIGSVYSTATTEEAAAPAVGDLVGPFSDDHAVESEETLETATDDERTPRRQRAESTSSFESGRVSLFSRRLSLGMKPIQHGQTQRFSWSALDAEERLKTRRASELLKERVLRGSVSEEPIVKLVDI